MHWTSTTNLLHSSNPAAVSSLADLWHLSPGGDVALSFIIREPLQPAYNTRVLSMTHEGAGCDTYFTIHHLLRLLWFFSCEVLLQWGWWFSPYIPQTSEITCPPAAVGSFLFVCLFYPTCLTCEGTPQDRLETNIWPVHRVWAVPGWFLFPYMAACVSVALCDQFINVCSSGWVWTGSAEVRTSSSWWVNCFDSQAHSYDWFTDRDSACFNTAFTGCL